MVKYIGDGWMSTVELVRSADMNAFDRSIAVLLKASAREKRESLSGDLGWGGLLNHERETSLLSPFFRRIGHVSNRNLNLVEPGFAHRHAEKLIRHAIARLVECEWCCRFD